MTYIRKVLTFVCDKFNRSVKVPDQSLIVIMEYTVIIIKIYHHTATVID